MTETHEGEASPVPAEIPPPPSPSPPAPPPQPRNVAKALTMLALVLLAVGFIWQAMRVDELSAKFAGLLVPSIDPAQLAALDGRITALERRAPADLRPLEARLTAVERRAAPAATGAAVDLSPLESRLLALEQKPAPAAPPADPRVDALSARLDRLAGATLALATEEAALRLDFPEAARLAAAASRAPSAGLPLGERILAQISSLVTVKDGDHVLSGPPAAPALELAQRLVAAGDIAGAAKALDGIDPGAAQAMAPWKARAERFVTARAALAKAGG